MDEHVDIIQLETVLDKSLYYQQYSIAIVVVFFLSIREGFYTGFAMAVSHLQLSIINSTLYSLHEKRFCFLNVICLITSLYTYFDMSNITQIIH